MSGVKDFESCNNYRNDSTTCVSVSGYEVSHPSGECIMQIKECFEISHWLITLLKDLKSSFSIHGC